MRMQAGIVVGVLLGVLAGWMAGATVTLAHAKVSPSVHNRLIPLYGSPRLLVYASRPGARRVSPYHLGSNSMVHVLNSDGHHRALGALGRDGEVSLAGSTLLITSRQDRMTLVRWWDFSDAKHGSFQTDEQVIGARPDGWLYEVHEGGIHVISKLFSGERTDLGDPIESGIGYGVVAGSSGFVGYANDEDDNNGAVGYVKWDGHRRTLLPPGNLSNSCGGMSDKYLACIIQLRRRTDGTFYPMALIPLDGSTPTLSYNKCVGSGRPPVVFRGSVATVIRGYNGCADGQLDVLSRSGKLTTSKARYGPTAITVAFRRIVVANRSQRKLFALTSARSRPTTLITAS